MRLSARIILPLLPIVIACGRKTDAPVNPPGGAAVSAVPDTVPTILAITCAINKSAPPQLVVMVGGEVPRGGYTGEHLAPRVYVTPPADGIWDYDFVAIPPQIGTTVMTPIQAEHTWPGFPEANLRGVRVHGVGGGVKQSLLTECNQATSR